jgi:hypothetical protein
LSDDERYLLRLRLEGLNKVAISKLFNVHHSKVSRRLERISVAVEHAVRSELRATLRVRGQDCDSLVRSMLGRLDTSIRRHVRLNCEAAAS